MIETAIQSILTSDSDVNTDTGGRVRHMTLAQNTSYPAVTYQRVFSERVEAMGGPDGLVRADMQIDAWAESSIDVWDLAEKCRKALEQYSGTAAGVVVVAVQGWRQRDDYEPPQDGDEYGVYRVINECVVWFKETGAA